MGANTAAWVRNPAGKDMLVRHLLHLLRGDWLEAIAPPDQRMFLSRLLLAVYEAELRGQKLTKTEACAAMRTDVMITGPKYIRLGQERGLITIDDKGGRRRHFLAPTERLRTIVDAALAGLEIASAASLASDDQVGKGDNLVVLNDYRPTDSHTKVVKKLNGYRARVLACVADRSEEFWVVNLRDLRMLQVIEGAICSLIRVSELQPRGKVGRMPETSVRAFVRHLRYVLEGKEEDTEFDVGYYFNNAVIRIGRVAGSLARVRGVDARKFAQERPPLALIVQERDRFDDEATGAKSITFDQLMRGVELLLYEVECYLAQHAPTQEEEKSTRAAAR